MTDARARLRGCELCLQWRAGARRHRPDRGAGAVTALMGPSGCGKSTLVAIAAGLLEPTSGQSGASMGVPRVMFQDPLLLPWRTALANVAFALKADRLERGRAAGAGTGGAGHGRSVRRRHPQIPAPALRRHAPARGSGTRAGHRAGPAAARRAVQRARRRLARQMLALVRSVVDQRGVSALVVTHDRTRAARFAEQVVQLSQCPARVVAVSYPGQRG